jgi:hypothetical protein
MLKQMKKSVALIGGLLGLFLIISPCFGSLDIEKGSVLGFVYEKDGTTPIQGAVVKLKNVRSREIYESTPSDSQGNFLIEQMESGVYIYGVTASEGDYNCNGMIGVRIDGNEPAKMSLALNRYADKENNEEKNPNENTAGEYLVGEVLSYNPKTQRAEVRILRGVLEKNDRVHVLGKAEGEMKETDFHQKVDNLNLNGSKVKRLFVEQIGYFKTKNPVKEGDLVYLAENQSGLLGFLVAPCGWAALLGAASIGYITYTETTDGGEGSAYKK